MSEPDATNNPDSSAKQAPPAPAAPDPATPTPPSNDQEEEKTAKVEELSPEEQLARYEESLKNDDWGHQPC